MKKTYFKSGDYSAICDVCGFKFKASKLKTRWDGLKVCSSDWEERHPQDFLRVFTDTNKMSWTRPESTDVFIPRTIPVYLTSQLTLDSSLNVLKIVFDGSRAINGKSLNDEVLNG